MNSLLQAATYNLISNIHECSLKPSMFVKSKVGVHIFNLNNVLYIMLSLLYIMLSSCNVVIYIIFFIMGTVMF